MHIMSEQRLAHERRLCMSRNRVLGRIYMCYPYDVPRWLI